MVRALAGWLLSCVLAQPLMSLNEQCGFPVRTFRDAAVAQAVHFLLVHNNQNPFCFVPYLERFSPSLSVLSQTLRRVCTNFSEAEKKQVRCCPARVLMSLSARLYFHWSRDLRS